MAVGRVAELADSLDASSVFVMAVSFVVSTAGMTVVATAETTVAAMGEM